MAWVRIGDEFYQRPEVWRAGAAGLGLHIAALSYASRHLTDGVIPEIILRALVSDEDATAIADRLVAVGLLHRSDHECPECPPAPTGHLVAHGYAEWQPSADEQRDLRRKRSEAGRKGGQRSGAQRQSNSEASGWASGSARSEAAANHAGEPRPFPSRPVPPPHDPPVVAAALRLRLAQSGWRSTKAGRESMAADGTTDALRALNERFPDASADHLHQMLDKGPLYQRYAASES